MADGDAPMDERDISRRRTLQLAGAAGVVVAAQGLGEFGPSTAQAQPLPPAFDGGVRLRGMTANAKKVTAADLTALANTGANVVRLMFGQGGIESNSAPFRQPLPPYAINEAAFDLLDQHLATCQSLAMYVIIDAHDVPGDRPAAGDPGWKLPMWEAQLYQDLLIDLWAEIARRYADRGNVIAGYDVFNEPAIQDPTATSGLASWIRLARDLVETIRSYDSTHKVVLEPAIGPKAGTNRWWGRNEAVGLLPAYGDTTVVSPHFYLPWSFCHQATPGTYHYPGLAPVQSWEGYEPAGERFIDPAFIARALAPVVLYEQTHDYKIPVYMGEFSSDRWLGDYGGNTWIRDLVVQMESHSWHWTYHAWREATDWDAEKNNFVKSDENRYPNTARLELLRGYFN